jgi:hypothetical protein
MAAISLAKDKFGHPIQALPLGARVEVAISAASARVALPAGTTIVRVAHNNPCYIKFGDNTVTVSAADGHLCPGQGVEIFILTGGETNIAAIQDGAVTGKVVATNAS